MTVRNCWEMMEKQRFMAGGNAKFSKIVIWGDMETNVPNKSKALENEMPDT